MQISIDREGWAFHNIANGIKKYVDHNVEIVLKENLKKEPTLFLGGCQPKYPEYCNVLFCSIGIKDIYNVKRVSSYNPIVTEHIKHLNPIEIPQSFDPDLFMAKRTKGNKLRVGFSGNKNRKEKRYFLFSQVKDLLSNNSNIEFKEALLSQDKIDYKQDEIQYFYQNIDLLLCTSYNDCGPGPCFEAGIMGIPSLVCSDIGFTKVVKDYFIADPTPQSLTEKILFLEKNRDLLETVGENAKKAIFEKHTFSANKQHWINSLNFMDDL